ncbi:MAG: hypothetical protein HYR95_02355 [Candidatus Colwellbacteria bacterium]|nr:hypothetical protein [Candidatus Colwellbacteria bacterium]MBI3274188.1 hypothetical protein [Candidatus Colwellbacteria bacterium]
MLKFIISATVVALVSLLQTTNLAFVGGVKPDFSLVLVLFMSILYKDWLKRSILIFIAAFVLKFSPGLEIENVIFIVSAITGVLLLDWLPMSPILNLFIITGAATVVFNLSAFEIQVFAEEFIYNLMVLSLCLVIYNLWRRK